MREGHDWGKIAALIARRFKAYRIVDVMNTPLPTIALLLDQLADEAKAAK